MRTAEIIVLCLIMGFVCYAIMNVSSRESRWEEQREREKLQELELTDAEEDEDDDD